MDTNNDYECEVYKDTKLNNLLCTFKMINTYDKFSIVKFIQEVNVYIHNKFILTVWDDSTIKLKVKYKKPIIIVNEINPDRVIKFIQKFK